ncbi:glutaredoxin [Sphingomonas sabuli]|uniref:Glutaredoxin n=2 Tax=Sphingomonas sabuli TaxID=2764186 RepID=A0A7G9L648_9SPHN|nr:glutaredoxin [Sphingomonas sabuli]
MILPDHTCPYGVRSKEMLDSEGIEFEDNILESREQTDAFKEEHGVSTTPQLFVDGERIGGSTEVEQWIKSRTEVAPE